MVYGMDEVKWNEMVSNEMRNFDAPKKVLHIAPGEYLRLVFGL